MELVPCLKTEGPLLLGWITQNLGSGYVSHPARGKLRHREGMQLDQDTQERPGPSHELAPSSPSQLSRVDFSIFDSSDSL